MSCPLPPHPTKSAEALTNDPLIISALHINLQLLITIIYAALAAYHRSLIVLVVHDFASATSDSDLYPDFFELVKPPALFFGENRFVFH